MVAPCVTCGSELHPERTEKYDYCSKRACREQNARPLRIAAAGVNKAADQYLLLSERAKEDLALIYSAKGTRPDEIAERLGVSRYMVAQMILSAKDRVKR